MLVVGESQLCSTHRDTAIALYLPSFTTITIEESNYKDEIAIKEVTQKSTGRNEVIPNQPLKNSFSTAIDISQNASHDVRIEPDFARKFKMETPLPPHKVLVLRSSLIKLIKLTTSHMKHQLTKYSQFHHYRPTLAVKASRAVTVTIRSGHQVKNQQTS